MNLKEVAKFFSGFFVMHTLGHLIFPTYCACAFPLRTWWGMVTITPSVNWAIVIISALISIYLIWYAWYKK